MFRHCFDANFTNSDRDEISDNQTKNEEPVENRDSIFRKQPNNAMVLAVIDCTDVRVAGIVASPQFLPFQTLENEKQKIV